VGGDICAGLQIGTSVSLELGVYGVADCHAGHGGVRLPSDGSSCVDEEYLLIRSGHNLHGWRLVGKAGEEEGRGVGSGSEVLFKE